MGGLSVGAVSYRIAVVDNDTRALMSMRDLINDRLVPSRVIWTTEHGIEAIKFCRDARFIPDLLIVDMSLEDLSGASVCRRIRTRSARPFILGITSFSLRRYKEVAADCGAQGLIGKSDEQEILNGVSYVASGATFPGFDIAQIAHLRLRHSSATYAPLSIREEEVITLLAERGLSNHQIAQELDIGEATVRKHIQHIVSKLGAESVRHAAALWLSRS